MNVMESSTRIPFRITGYQDLFSDFDPRHYSERSLSEDFLSSLNQATRYLHTGDEFQLAFEVPKSERNGAAEENITKRLHGHFKKHVQMLQREKQRLLQRGVKFLLAGLFLISIAMFVVSLEKNGIEWSMIRVLLEPSGWFISWFGLDHIFYLTQETEQKLDFYRKMSRAEIKFSAVS
jgi:hypothetical protein